MHERERKKNKETKKRMHDAAMLCKDTSKLEKKIEQYRNIKRKLTNVETEKLHGLEAELKETVKRQKEAGIEPIKRLHIEGQAIGYDPLAATEDQSDLVDYGSSLDGESIDEEAIGKEIYLDGEEGDREPVVGDGPEIGMDERGSSLGGHESDALDDEQFPPMPAETPPPLPEDMDSEGIWPVVPSGPSPQFQAHHLQPNIQRKNNSFGTRGRGRQYPNNGERGGGAQRGRGRGRGNTHHQHYMQEPTRPIQTRTGQFPPQPPPAPPFAASTQNPAIRRPPPHHPQPSTSSGTVLAAEPQVRDLKKELTTLVPSAIARKNKQKDRQRVLESVPMAPQMVINSAPDVGIDQADPANRSEQKDVSSTTRDIIGNVRPAAGMNFSAALKSNSNSNSSRNGSKPPKKEVDKNDSGSLDNQYQKFMSQMDKIL
ncbi:hypothetical protein IW140_004690 [Coemansia sp. RSA 1813]|nr:SUMO1 sentrin specific peptidase 8 [Coemansia sp. RSA 1646]KAJ1768938.1 hypothetical protein LPJ74_004485 [Coemansia sp. RSA 1843]KAJ2087682.1 hypothetical protein IW138_004803 [Coemansia sp. RSA 986]KAJ2212611.1 hypothetical protein EV179_004515 [Coemansia sp. RSA 487]KAJ2567048.1 hypothetical protein IW140_004690 [Coemansia sp. RSA 1813]